MKISSISGNTFGTKPFSKNNTYAKPVKTGAFQQGILKEAIDELENTSYDKNDIAYIKSMGINPPFESGKDAINYLKEKNIPVQYGKFSDKRVHACLVKGENGKEVILINKRYKNSKNKAEILAISEAIDHEAGHAKDMDKKNSIQEELDNLSLNVLAHRAHEKKYSGVFDNSHSFIFREGVCLYPKLFFENNPSKTGLKLRIADKYGHLPVGDEKHPPSKLANEIKEINSIV